MKTFKDRQTQTKRTGAFKDRITRELRRHTWNQMNNSHKGETGPHNTRGAKTVQGCIPESTVNLPSAKPWTFGWLTPNLAYSRYVVPKMHPGVSSINSRVCSWLRLKTFSTERRIDESLWKRTLRKRAPCCFSSSFVQWSFTCLVHIAT